MKSVRVGLGLSLVVGLWASTALAAGEKKKCVAAYEQGQAARKEGKLRAARESFLTCSQAACPGFVKTDCTRWLGEIESSLPTVVFEVRDAAGLESRSVRVLVDGEVVAADGKALTLDPGEHTVRYELAGETAIDERVVIREGEKNRKLTASFVKAAPPPVVVPVAPAPTEEGDKGGAPVAAWVLGGVGLAGAGLFATFAILASNERSSLAKSCAPNCSDDQVRPARVKAAVADVSLGVGLASLAVATVLFIRAPSKRAASAPAFQLVAEPRPGGAFAGFASTF